MKQANGKRAIVVVGATGTGKTALGVQLAQQLNSDVISADSQLVYQGLDIGTAKPDEGERQGVHHHMIDVAPPNEVYSAAMYHSQARPHLERLWAENRIPVVVGGTGFYIKALLQPSIIPDVLPNPAFRETLTAQAAQEGTEALHRRLQALDPRRAAELHPNDQFRIVRALEIIEATGQPVPQEEIAKGISLLWLGLTYGDRQDHNRRLEERTRHMLADGWLEEVEALLARYGAQAHALNVALGYPQLVQVLTQQLSMPEALESITIATRQYARRQAIWFRRNADIHWLDRGVLSPVAQSLLIQSALQQWLGSI